MAITFFSAKQFARTLKVTIQKTGRLGFTSATAIDMQIDTDTYFRFGKDDSINADLIMVKSKEQSVDAFRALKTGDYYYLNTAALFDMLKYEYKKGNIIFDVRREAKLDEEAGGEVYTLRQRASKSSRRKKEDSNSISLDLDFAD